MDPLVALAYYMTCQSLRSEFLAYNTDPTVKLLYTITNKIVAKGWAKIKKKVMVNEFLEDIESKYPINSDDCEHERRLLSRNIAPWPTEQNTSRIYRYYK